VIKSHVALDPKRPLAGQDRTTAIHRKAVSSRYSCTSTHARTPQTRRKAGVDVTRLDPAPGLRPPVRPVGGICEADLVSAGLGHDGCPVGRGRWGRVRLYVGSIDWPGGGFQFMGVLYCSITVLFTVSFTVTPQETECHPTEWEVAPCLLLGFLSSNAWPDTNFRPGLHPSNATMTSGRGFFTSRRLESNSCSAR